MLSVITRYVFNLVGMLGFMKQTMIFFLKQWRAVFSSGFTVSVHFTLLCSMWSSIGASIGGFYIWWKMSFPCEWLACWACAGVSGFLLNQCFICIYWSISWFLINFSVNIRKRALRFLYQVLPHYWIPSFFNVAYCTFIALSLI